MENGANITLKNNMNYIKFITIIICLAIVSLLSFNFGYESAESKKALKPETHQIVMPMDKETYESIQSQIKNNMDGVIRLNLKIVQ
jgi:hypothetical protein